MLQIHERAVPFVVAGPPSSGEQPPPVEPRAPHRAWTPNGTLLLGTSLGRLLGVYGAAPPAIPAAGWGVHAAGGHEAHLLYGPPTSALEAAGQGPAGAGSAAEAEAPAAGVVAVVVTTAHVLLVMAGGGWGRAQLLAL